MSSKCEVTHFGDKVIAVSPKVIAILLAFLTCPASFSGSKAKGKVEVEQAFVPLKSEAGLENEVTPVHIIESRDKKGNQIVFSKSDVGRNSSKGKFLRLVMISDIHIHDMALGYDRNTR